MVHTYTILDILNLHMYYRGVLFYNLKSKCQCPTRNIKGSRFGTGCSKAGSVSSFVGQGSHINGGVDASCSDRRTTSMLHENDPLVVRSGPAATAIAADDHDDDEENRAANHSSLATIVHLMPPSKDTLIKK